MDAIEGCGWATLLGGQNRNRLDRREARACRLEARVDAIVEGVMSDLRG